MKIYSLYNNRLSYYNKPFYAESDAEAKQYIINVICAGVDTSISNCINDLELWLVGEFTPTVDGDSYGGPISSCFTYVCSVSELRQYLPEELIVYKQAQILKSISTLENSIENLSNSFNNLCSKNKKLKM